MFTIAAGYIGYWNNANSADENNRVLFKIRRNWLSRIVISLRKKAGNFYNKLLEKNENLTIVDNYESSFNYYSIVLKNGDRDELQNYLNEAGVSTAIYYPKTLPSLPAHNVTKKFPNAEFLSKNILSIPIFPSIEEDQQIYVADKIKEFYLNN